jgi:heme o synthase
VQDIQVSSATPDLEPRLGRLTRIGQLIAAYVALMKPRVLTLLLITTFAAMVLAEGGLPPLGLVALTLLGGALAAGGANAINQFIDRDIDTVMRRTRHRPVPSHLVTPRQALLFGIGAGVASFLLLAVTVNPLAAFLAMTGLLFYVVVYSLWLKRSTPQNIVIGGAAGAIPPLVGWAAVSDSLSLTALYLFAIIFFWTPPHFWALSLLLKNDYAEARVPMLPVIVGVPETTRQIMLYVWLLIGVTVLPFTARAMGGWYLAAALLLGGALLYYAVRLQQAAGASPSAIGASLSEPERYWARRLFFFSNAYLAFLFAAMLLDRVVLGGGEAALLALLAR